MILLDTHVLIWWVNGDLNRLSKAALAAIDRNRQTNQKQKLLVSAISCWEVAMLLERGRLSLSMDSEKWFDLISCIPAIKLLPLQPWCLLTPESGNTPTCNRYGEFQPRTTLDQCR